MRGGTCVGGGSAGGPDGGIDAYTDGDMGDDIDGEVTFLVQK